MDPLVTSEGARPKRPTVLPVILWPSCSSSTRLSSPRPRPPVPRAPVPRPPAPAPPPPKPAKKEFVQRQTPSTPRCARSAFQLKTCFSPAQLDSIFPLMFVSVHLPL